MIQKNKVIRPNLGKSYEKPRFISFVPMKGLSVYANRVYIKDLQT